MKENMTQTQKAKQVFKLARGSVPIPQREKMVKVGGLLSATDKRFIKENHVGLLAVEVEKGFYFLSSEHTVPAGAKLVRQEAGQFAGQVLGIPAVAGG